MTKLTRYEQGFLTKCAEYDVPKQVAGAMLKHAQEGLPGGYTTTDAGITYQPRVFPPGPSIANLPRPQHSAAKKIDLSSDNIRRVFSSPTATLRYLVGKSNRGAQNALAKTFPQPKFSWQINPANNTLIHAGVRY